jgi:hypothetical protein
MAMSWGAYAVKNNMNMIDEIPHTWMSIFIFMIMQCNATVSETSLSGGLGWD